MPAQMFPDALFKQLTKDIQVNNEKDFLSLVAPDARPAVQTSPSAAMVSQSVTIGSS
jgi:hypothetical protein